MSETVSGELTFKNKKNKKELHENFEIFKYNFIASSVGVPFE